MFLSRILSNVHGNWLTVSFITILLVGISNDRSIAFADSGDPESSLQQPAVLPPDKPKYPRLDSKLNKLVRQIGSMGAETVAVSGSVSIGDLVAVTVRVSHNVTSTVDFLESVGAILANIGADYIEAYTPVTVLAPLSERDGVLKVATILPHQPEVTSQGTSVHRSPLWRDRQWIHQV
jgi:hypothetical protein